LKFKKLSCGIVISLSLALLLSGCITKFIPEISDNKNLLVVDGLITDQFETYSVKLSTSSPLGTKTLLNPVKEARVTVTDDYGNSYNLYESVPGTYISDSMLFRGIIGRKYSLHLQVKNGSGNYSYYESVPMEMIPVPPIDSVFYEKIAVKEADQFYNRIDACQIYLDTHDETGKCKYYKWNYSETWEFHLHWEQPNKVCWITQNSTEIKIKNSSSLIKDQISRYPLNYISNSTDRLQIKYSILANQYSISADEYAYWDKLKTYTEDTGSLFDLTPSFVPGNMSCLNDPSEQVLGYFSVSAKTSRRIFIKDNFDGQLNFYSNCATMTITNPGYIAGLGSYLWVLETGNFTQPPYVILTDKKWCVDCTVRGTKIKPAFWQDK
jgi:hypothetical protein